VLDSAVTWTEPTRRLVFRSPFSYDGRYGASLVGLLLGGYLLMQASIEQLALALSGGTAWPLEYVAVMLLQLAFAVIVVVASLLIAPATPTRRAVAAVVAVAVIVAWMLLAGGRLSGDLSGLPFWTYGFTTVSFAGMLAPTLGWLIVRERPARTYALLLLTLIAGAVPFWAIDAGVPGVLVQTLLPGIALGTGVGIAWLARVLAVRTPGRAPLPPPTGPAS